MLSSESANDKVETHNARRINGVVLSYSPSSQNHFQFLLASAIQRSHERVSITRRWKMCWASSDLVKRITFDWEVNGTAPWEHLHVRVYPSAIHPETVGWRRKRKKGEAIGDLIRTPPTCSYPWILAIQSTCSPWDVHTRHSRLSTSTYWSLLIWKMYNRPIRVTFSCLWPNNINGRMKKTCTLPISFILFDLEMRTSCCHFDITRRLYYSRRHER